MMSLWSTPEHVHSALQQAGMHASDLQFAETIDKFQQFHTDNNGQLRAKADTLKSVILSHSSSVI